MLFIRKPKPTPSEYILLSEIYGLNDHGEDVPFMTKRQAMAAARYFLAMVDDPDAIAQVVNVNNKQVYKVQRISTHPDVFLITWVNGNC